MVDRSQHRDCLSRTDVPRSLLAPRQPEHASLPPDAATWAGQNMVRNQTGSRLGSVPCCRWQSLYTSREHSEWDSVSKRPSVRRTVGLRSRQSVQYCGTAPVTVVLSLFSIRKPESGDEDSPQAARETAFPPGLSTVAVEYLWVRLLDCSTIPNKRITLRDWLTRNVNSGTLLRNSVD